MWGAINDFLSTVENYVWGIPLMALILVGGTLLTIRLGLIQVRKLPLALRWMVRNEKGGKGEVSSFAALCTSLSATIGTGNIVGVATAIGLGGPGALFWMLIAAFVGMATKYTEGLLTIKYRTVDPKTGHALGGPFYYIERGMGKGWKWLAVLFAVLCPLAALLGTGTFTQVNGVTSALRDFFDPNNAYTVAIPGIGTYSLVTIIASIILTVVVGIVLIGGIKRIATVSEVIVPFMAILYFVTILILMLTNVTAVPAAFGTIIKGAFDPAAVTGGVVGGIFVAMQSGISRGIFSNEAGLGTGPIAAASAKTKEPVRQGLVSMTGTFIDTIIICTMTGLAIVITGAWQVEGLEGVQVTTYAFREGLPFHPQVSSFILMISLVFFAFTTILGWCHYSEKCLEYLTGGKKAVITVFRILYIAAVFIGPYMTVSAIWTSASIFNGLMAIPNMIAMFALSGVAASETHKFFKMRKQIHSFGE